LYIHDNAIYHLNWLAANIYHLCRLYRLSLSLLSLWEECWNSGFWNFPGIMCYALYIMECG